MTQSNSDRIEEIFHAALALPESERSEFVAKECGGDARCILEVSSLLTARARSGVLDDPVVELGATSDRVVGAKIDDRYKIERELAPGGMGRVFVVSDDQLHGKLRVIKVLPHTSIDPDAVRRFEREVKALTLISHPGVVSVIGTNELKGSTPYIVMEYIDGPTLGSQIPSNGMDVKRAASLIKQIGAAVGHVHDKGILHLDLKPANIMLQLHSDGTEVVKIVDFGIAKIKDSVSATGVINTVPIGTRAYMSPEQLRGGETITAASDIYSMAVVTCEMITGERPKQPEAGSQRGWRPKRIELPQGLSAKAQNLIARALSFDPNNRPQSAKQFGDELAEALLKHEKTSLRDRPWTTMKKWLSAVVAVLVLAGLSYGIYKYLVTPKSPLRPLTSATTQTKGFNYWLMVQRTREGKDYEEPKKSNGRDDVFDNGDKFQLNVFTLEPGYLYIFNEGPSEPNTASFRMIYPKRVINEGSASVGGNQTVESDWITFRGPAGTDNFWIVWSLSPVSELESARDDALNHPQAGLMSQSLVRTREFLKTTQATLNVRTRRFEANQEATVRSNSDIVLTLAQFKHR